MKLQVVHKAIEIKELFQMVWRRSYERIVGRNRRRSKEMDKRNSFDRDWCRLIQEVKGIAVESKEEVIAVSDKN